MTIEKRSFIERLLGGSQEENEDETILGQPEKLFELSPEALNALKEVIATSNGLIRIFVHPEFEEYAKTVSDQATKDKLARMAKGFKRTLQSGEEDSPPIFIFHPLNDIRYFRGHDRYDSQAQALLKSPFYAREKFPYKSYDDVYIVPTSAFNPDPIMQGAENEDAAWVQLRNFLRTLGVSKIIIGGAELYVPGKQLLDMKGGDVMDNLRGCVGETVMRLRKEFAVDLSLLTYPEGRGDVKKAEAKQ